MNTKVSNILPSHALCVGGVWPSFSAIFAIMRFWNEILRLVRPYRGYAVLSGLSNILAVLFGLVSISMLLPFLDLLFGRTQIITTAPALKADPASLNAYVQYLMGDIIRQRGQIGALAFLSLGIIILFFLKNIFRYLGMYFMSPLRNGIVRDLRNALYEHTLILPLSYYAGKRSGDIITRMSQDVQEVEWSITNFLIMFLREPIALLIFLTALIIINPWLTLIAAVLIPVAGFFINLISKRLQKNAGLGQERLGWLTSILDETIQGIRIIKSFNAISLADEKYRKSNEQFTRVLTRVYRQRDLAAPLTEMLVVLVLMTILWYGGNQVLSDSSTLDAGVFLLYLAVFSQVIPPAKSLITAYYYMRKGEASLVRIRELLEAEEVITEKPEAVMVSKMQSGIRFEDVSFAYLQDNVLDHINLEIRQGDCLAIVGASGSGKSTLLNLIPRFYDPVSGRITMDGMDIRDLNIAGLRALTGLVSQDTILFNDTVKQNILMGLNDVGDNEIERAARLADAHTFIISLPQGYDTLIGDRGLKLSGGQRQRLALARAILRNPPLLLLDEATSSLDTQAEAQVQAAIDASMQGRTTVIVAHRLSTIRQAGRIIVMEKGKIVEEGDHARLMQKKGRYYNLWTLQSAVPDDQTGQGEETTEYSDHE